MLVSMNTSSAPINNHVNMVVQSPIRLGWVKTAVGLPEGLNYPGQPSHSNHVFAVLPSDRPKGSCFSSPASFFLFLLLMNGNVYPNPGLVFFLISVCHILVRPLILLYFLMSSNVHHNPGPVFSCSVCTGNVTRRVGLCNAAPDPKKFI